MDSVKEKYKDADGYCRVSTKGQSTGLSGRKGLQRYKEDLIDIGIDKDRIFSDAASGDKSDREGYQIILQRIRKGITKKVVVNALDRLTRNRRDILDFVDELKSFNVEIEVLGMNVLNLHDPETEERIYAAINTAAFVRAKNKKYALDGNARRRKKKKPFCPPFGYLVANDEYVVNRQSYKSDPTITTYEVARDVVNTYLAEGTVRGTVAILAERYGNKRYRETDDSMRPSDDFPHDRKTLTKWLKNPILRGHLAYGGSGRKGTPDRWIAQFNNHEAIISEAEGKAIDLKLSAKASGISPSNKVKFSMTGLVKCACGDEKRDKTSGKTVVSGRQPRRFYCWDIYDPLGTKQCDKRGGVQTTEAEEYAIRAICQRAEEIAEIIVEERPKELPQESPEVQKLKEERLQLVMMNNPRLQSVIDDLDKEISELERQNNTETEDDTQVRDVMLRVGKDPNFWQALSLEEKRFVFMQLIDKLVIDSGSIIRVDFKRSLGTINF